MVVCPDSADQPPESNSTLGAHDRMVVERGVTLVMQIDPFVDVTDDDGDVTALLAFVSRRGCGVWPHQAYGEVKLLEHDARTRFLAMEYMLGGRVIYHAWYYGWRDFSVPPPEHRERILVLARRAAGEMKAGNRVVIACHSGRGRSGTMAALVVGMREGIRTDDRLVEAVVRMR
jgi:hypothetical protein